ncbi:hypothetical protein HK098_003750 [Nowakowskiella sp. JEL0407]|nr:hypothetical protein HK098_003750 [Nowakowskiella sp. JEL0407]
MDTEKLKDDLQLLQNERREKESELGVMAKRRLLREKHRRKKELELEWIKRVILEKRLDILQKVKKLVYDSFEPGYDGLFGEWNIEPLQKEYFLNLNGKVELGEGSWRCSVCMAPIKSTDQPRENSIHPICRKCQSKYSFCDVCQTFRPLDLFPTEFFSVSNLMHMNEVDSERNNRALSLMAGSSSSIAANIPTGSKCSLLHIFWDEKLEPQTEFAVYDAPKLCYLTDVVDGVPVMDKCQTLFFETAISVHADALQMEGTTNTHVFSSLERIRERCSKVWNESVSDFRFGMALKATKRIITLAVTHKPASEESSANSSARSKLYIGMMASQWAKAERTMMISILVTGTAMNAVLAQKLIQASVLQLLQDAKLEGHAPPIILWRLTRDFTPKFNQMLKNCGFKLLHEAEEQWNSVGWFNGHPERQLALHSVKCRFEYAIKKSPQAGSQQVCYVLEVENIVSGLSETTIPEGPTIPLDFGTSSLEFGFFGDI